MDHSQPGFAIFLIVLCLDVFSLRKGHTVQLRGGIGQMLDGMIPWERTKVDNSKLQRLTVNLKSRKNAFGPLETRAHVYMI